MNAEFVNGNIRAVCRRCGIPVTFEWSDNGRQFGSYEMPLKQDHSRMGFQESRIVWQLYRCAGCGAGAIAAIECYQRVIDGRLRDFFPTATENLPLPKDVPQELVFEFREAEDCMANECYRAAWRYFDLSLRKLSSSTEYGATI